MNTNEVTVNVVAQVPGTNVVTINMIAPPSATNSLAANAQAAAQAINSAGTNSETIPGPISTFWSHSHHFVHILIIICLAVIAHVLVTFIRNFSETIITRSYEKRNPLGFMTQQPKFITLSRLIISTVAFLIYAVAIYVIIALEFPNENTLKTYFGSAAVIGLALSFGLQGLVQDVVTGITLILSDSMDVGDVVDLMNNAIGRVEWIGLRFTKIINFYNQEIFVPNRNIINVSRFPHGGILAYADVQIPAHADQAKVLETIQGVSKGVQSQFGAIILTEPVFSKVLSTPGNWTYMRVQFKIWPGQNGIIENTFVQQMVAAMKAHDPNYATWQIVVTYRTMH